MGRETRPRRAGFLLLAVAGAALVACGDDPVEPVATPLEPFVGSWRATVFEFRPLPETGSGAEPVDLVEFGVALSLEVEDDGTFVISQVIPGAEPGIDTGVLEVEAEAARLRLVFDEALEEPLTGSFIFSQDDRVLTIVLSDAVFDFSGNGQPVPAQARIVFERR